MQNNQRGEIDKTLYTIAVLRYKQAHPDIDTNQLFPLKWKLSNNYYLKNNIIAEAINNNILIEETKLFNEYFLNDYK